MLNHKCEISSQPKNVQLLTYQEPFQKICEICNRGFKNDSELKKHILNSHNSQIKITKPEIKPCEQCGKTFKNYLMAQNHVCNDDRTCTFCGLSFENVDILNTHILEIHNNQLQNKTLYIKQVLVKAKEDAEIRENSPKKPETTTKNSIGLQRRIVKLGLTETVKKMIAVVNLDHDYTLTNNFPTEPMSKEVSDEFAKDFEVSEPKQTSVEIYGESLAKKNCQTWVNRNSQKNDCCG